MGPGKRRLPVRRFVRDGELYAQNSRVIVELEVMRVEMMQSLRVHEWHPNGATEDMEFA